MAYLNLSCAQMIPEQFDSLQQVLSKWHFVASFRFAHSLRFPPLGMLPPLEMLPPLGVLPQAVCPSLVFFSKF